MTSRTSELETRAILTESRMGKLSFGIARLPLRGDDLQTAGRLVITYLADLKIPITLADLKIAVAATSAAQ